MSDSQVTDWIDENMYRAYPLQDRQNVEASSGYVLTNDVLLDALLFASGDVELTSIVAASGDITFHLDNGLDVVVDRDETFPFYYRDADGSLVVIGEAVLDIPEATHTFTAVKFEPSVVFDLTGAWLGVSSLQFTPVYAGLPLTDASSSQLTGLIELVEGYQLSIQIPSQELLQLSAGRLDGLPIGCTNFRTTTQDNCTDIVSTINGVASGELHDVALLGGNGILILNDPTNHRIFVGATFNTQDVCALPELPPFGAL